MLGFAVRRGGFCEDTGFSKWWHFDSAPGARKPRQPMPQLQFPFFPEGVTHITALLAFEKKEGRITYFNAGMPVFAHDEKRPGVVPNDHGPVLCERQYQAG
jgi:hypothetical protein